MTTGVISAVKQDGNKLELASKSFQLLSPIQMAQGNFKLYKTEYPLQNEAIQIAQIIGLELKMTESNRVKKIILE